MSENKVTKAQLEALLDASETQEAIFWKKEMVVSYRLPCGFTVSGRAAVVDPENFDIEVGRRIARDEAIDQLWQLEGYLLQHRVAEQADSLTDELRRPLPSTSGHGHPRRNDVLLRTVAERKIYEALASVEDLNGDTNTSQASMKLIEAAGLVADYFESPPPR